MATNYNEIGERMRRVEEPEAEAEACPRATQDVTLNLRNRGRAIDKADYGPMDPNEPNDGYWTKLARIWDVPPDEARTMRCGNCGAFNQTERMLGCIEQGLEGEGRERDAMDVVEAGDLGFCEVFDFKCASARTCSAWIAGGPIKDGEESEEEGEEEGEEYEEESDEYEEEGEEET